MPSEGTQKIIKLFANGLKDFDTDISSLLEEYLTEVGLQQLNEDETETQFPNFPEAAIILQHSAAIYCKKVDCLWLMVQNAVQLIEKPALNDPENKATEKTTKKSRKRVGLSDFNFIELEEATNITMKENLNLRPSILPKAFSQFEPRIVTENDVQLKDYNNESIGLISDFRINWNTDENFMLCDDLDFCATSKLPENNTINPSMVSPADSGNLSDCFIDYNVDKNLLSPNCSTDDAISIEKSTVVNNELMTPTEKKLLLKPIVTKYDMTSPLSGTLKSCKEKISSCNFSLPSYIINKVKRKDENEKNHFKRFISDVYAGDDMNVDFSINKLSPAFKKSRKITWSRLEVFKKLKLNEFMASDVPIKGFSTMESTENDIIEALQKKCSHISISSYDPDIFATSEVEDDDNVPDNCYIGNQNNIFEPNIARRLAEADSLSSSCPIEQNSISKSVEAWHTLIQEKLKDVDKVKEFDMKEYCNDILQDFKQKSKDEDKCEVIKFSDVVKGKCKEDIARYFFTTLSLANKLKIAIQQPEPLHCGDFNIRKATKTSFK